MYSRHHILFMRRDWKRGYKHKLREKFIYTIPDDAHKFLHSCCEPVPAITEPQAKKLYQELNKIGKRMTMLEAYRWLIKHSDNALFVNALVHQMRCLESYLGGDWYETLH